MRSVNSDQNSPRGQACSRFGTRKRRESFTPAVRTTPIPNLRAADCEAAAPANGRSARSSAALEASRQTCSPSRSHSTTAS